jgi:hypothetical protein
VRISVVKEINEQYGEVIQSQQFYANCLQLKALNEDLIHKGRISCKIHAAALHTFL